MKNSPKINKFDNKILSLKKNGKRTYAVLSGVIFAIVIVHFAFQFSFIQSENFRIFKDLTGIGQFGKTEQIAEDTFVPEITETDENEKVEAKSATKTQKPKVVKDRPISTPIKKRTRTAPKRIIEKRKAPQPETRAERLRRTEKILTGA